MACEDFPCCGHEHGCCPDYDRNGRQLNMVCVCGARLPLDAPYSLCHHCMKQGQEDEGMEMERIWESEDMDGDMESGLASAGFGTDEDYQTETPMYDDYYGGE